MTPRVTLDEALYALTTERDALLRRTRALGAAIEALKELQTAQENGLANEALEALQATLAGPVAAPQPLPPTLRAELLALPPLPPTSTAESIDIPRETSEAGQASSEPAGEPASEVDAVDPRRDVEADQAILFALGTGHKTLTQLGKLAKKRDEPLKKAIDRTNYRLQRLMAECKVLRIQRGLYALPPSTPRRVRREPELEVAWNGSMKTPLCAANGGLGSALGGLHP